MATTLQPRMTYGIPVDSRERIRFTVSRMTYVLATTRGGEPVELHVWGLTEQDADRAQADAKAKHPAMFERAESVNVTRTIGGACPIRRRDQEATAQGASYNKAWAIYHPSDSEISGGEQP